VATTADNYKLFHDEKDVQDTIEKLTQKGVVRSNLIKRSVHNISLTLDNNIQDEIVGEIRMEFASAVEQACAIDKELKIIKNILTK
jgi:hypothetical protein